MVSAFMIHGRDIFTLNLIMRLALFERSVHLQQIAVGAQRRNHRGTEFCTVSSDLSL